MNHLVYGTWFRSRHLFASCSYFFSLLALSQSLTDLQRQRAAPRAADCTSPTANAGPIWLAAASAVSEPSPPSLDLVRSSRPMDSSESAPSRARDTGRGYLPVATAPAW